MVCGVFASLTAHQDQTHHCNICVDPTEQDVFDYGLCIVTQVADCVIQLWLITGDHAGSLIFVPWLKISPSDTQLPFEFEQRQFPL